MTLPPGPDQPAAAPSVDQSWSECFACGPNEAHGLRLKYRFLDAATIEAPIVFDRRFQGFNGVIHGGLLTTALDDAMANIACLQGETAVTGEITVRFRRPVMVGETVMVRAWVIRRSGKIMECEGSILDLDGLIRAESKGKFLITGPLTRPLAP